MRILGNIIWVIFGGLEVALGYFVAGAVLCLTIVGIPFGYQAFKIGLFALLPFGKTTVAGERGNGCLYVGMNILWVVTAGLLLALIHLIFGVALCITIIGIPLGLQHFKLMAVAFTPFGRDIVACK
jgi:uncharacterized membrane protein YccF (DUF307 family)